MSSSAIVHGSNTQTGEKVVVERRVMLPSAFARARLLGPHA